MFLVVCSAVAFQSVVSNSGQKMALIALNVLCSIMLELLFEFFLK